jgi:feruloyl-CoA hydratase/lyase
MATQRYQTVLIEKEDGITWLIMNRPEKRNAMSPQLHLEMDDALADLAVDPQTQILVFCHKHVNPNLARI